MAFKAGSDVDRDGGPALPTEATSAPSSLTRLLDALIAPSRSFEAIAADPRFLLCWGVEIAVAAGCLLYTQARVGVMEMARQVLAQNAAYANLAPEMQQRMLQTSAKMMHLGVYFAPAVVIVIALVLGLISLGVANLALGQQAKYRPMLAMASHALLPMSVLSLLAAVALAMSTDPAAFPFVNPLGTNVAFYLNRTTTSPFWYALAGHLDLFSLWTVLLLALGIARLGGRRGRFGTAAAVMVPLWVLYALLAAAPRAFV